MMTKYPLIIFTACLVFGIISLLIDGDIGAKLVLGVLTVWIILSPMSSLLSKIENGDFISSVKPPQSEIDSEYFALIEDAFADGIRKAAADEFDLDETDVRISLSGFDAQKMKAEKIRITLSGRAIIADYKAIESYINKMNLGECYVEIEVG